MVVIHIRDFRRRAAAAGALLILAAAVSFLLAGCLGRSGETDSPPTAAATEDERLAYLTELGWQVKPEPVETLVLQLPENVAASYGDYAALQEAQGFDFVRLGGKTVQRYTYAVENYPGYEGPVQLNLYVCDGVVAGGDVIAPGENGFLRELAFPE
ncbi:MAG: DUF4830 domain-containing protein [Ruminococcaceae bacterium]|nr:DUF4830 domain-containing protein [Oscillospiraceae bacterium]